MKYCRMKKEKQTAVQVKNLSQEERYNLVWKEVDKV